MATSFANVALTDTFETWRNQTNLVIADVNAGTDAGIANTVVRRDDDGNGGIRIGDLIANGSIEFNTTGEGGITSNSLRDVTDGTSDDFGASLSTGSAIFKGGISVQKSLNVGGSVYVAGVVKAEGNIQLGDDADVDTVTIVGDIAADITPLPPIGLTNTAISLGNNGERWKNLYVWDTVGANTTSHLKIPSGETSDRPEITDLSSTTNADHSLRGVIRYNTTLDRYEGYDHVSNTFMSLGGAIDSDQDTKITVETTHGGDEDEIKFYTEGTERWYIGSDTDDGYFLPSSWSGSGTELHIGKTDQRVQSVWANNVFCHNILGRDGETSITVPSGSSAQRPSTDLEDGMLRFNKEYDAGKGQMEYYSNTAAAWYQLSPSTTVYNTRIEAPTDSTTSVSAQYNPNWLQVFVNGIKLDSADYDTDVLGSAITFLNFTVGVDDIIDVMSMAATDLSKAAMTKERFVATASQTTFTINGGYTPGMIEVFSEGVKIDQSLLTATNATSVTIPAQTVGNIVESWAWTSFENTDVYTKDRWANTAGWSSVQANTYIGVDVTSHANATFAVDVHNDRIGIGVKEPQHTLDVKGNGTDAIQLKLLHSFAANTTFATNAAGELTITPSGQDTTLIGNLHITGTTTEVSSDTMTITDPFIVLNNFSAVPTNNAYDTGFVFIRGTNDLGNTAFIWDESLDEFSTCRVGDDGSAAGNITIADYENFHCGAIEIEDNLLVGTTSSFTGLATFNSNIDMSGGFFASDVLPDANGTRDMGSDSLRWANIYTSDLNLKNERGDWKVVEESDYLSLTNNLTGKKYKILMEEIEE